jgi:Putative beta-barrel porin 2
MLALWSSDVHAQAWLSDRKRAEGVGLRVGDLELHPGIGAEFGYLSNVYNDEENELASPILRVAPHLYLSTLSGERSGTDEGQTPGMIAFKGGVSANLEHYFAEGSPDTIFGADLNLELKVAPERPVSFTLTEVFNRTSTPFSDPATDPSELGSPGIDYARYTEVAAANLDFQTRGGLLKAGLGYRFGYNWYGADIFDDNDNLTHTIDLKAAWEFLPKTALFYDAAFVHQDYTANDEPPSLPGQSPLFDNNRISSRIGVNGAITSRISATLAVGYTVGLFEDDNDFEGVLLNAEGRWIPSPVSEWSVGFERTFSSAYQGNFVERNQAYTRLRFFFGGAMVVASKLAIEFLDFGVDPIQGPRSDTRYSADVSGEYRFVDWCAVTAQLGLLIDDTDFVSRIELPDNAGVVLDPAEFTAFEGWLGVRAFY